MFTYLHCVTLLIFFLKYGFEPVVEKSDICVRVRIHRIYKLKSAIPHSTDADSDELGRIRNKQ